MHPRGPRLRLGQGGALGLRGVERVSKLGLRGGSGRGSGRACCGWPRVGRREAGETGKERSWASAK